MIWLAFFTLLLTVIIAIEIFIGNRSACALRDVAPNAPTPSPRVSIIVAARNEQRNIREALQSLLNLRYPSYEVIVVDDRSEDATGAILDEMAREDHRIKAIHVEKLPAGWLGKNHALWHGSRQASGDLLLFTDADIVMESSVLSRAVRFMAEHRLDHLAASPSMRMPTPLLGMFGAAFIVIFSLFALPWKARDPKSRFHIGIGAFNLVRKEIYEQVGGHETIRLRPDDDIKLGKIIKRAGYRQDVAYAPEFLEVEWYASLGEVVRGLEKNAFSGTDYRVSLVLGGVLCHSLCSVWPFLAVFVTGGMTRLLYGLAAAILLVTVADSSRFHRSKPWYALGYPLTSALFVFILLRTMILNLVQGGIYWRGTFYSLKELKANRI